MAIIIKTNNPSGLLSAIHKAIDDNKVETWSYDSADKEFLMRAGEAAAVKFLAQKRDADGPTAPEIEVAQHNLERARKTMLAKRRWWRLRS